MSLALLKNKLEELWLEIEAAVVGRPATPAILLEPGIRARLMDNGATKVVVYESISVEAVINGETEMVTFPLSWFINDRYEDIMHRVDYLTKK